MLLYWCLLVLQSTLTYLLVSCLDLGINFVRGAIPTQVAGLPNLQSLRFRENRLTGTVPLQILNSGKLRMYTAQYLTCAHQCIYAFLISFSFSLF